MKFQESKAPFAAIVISIIALATTLAAMELMQGTTDVEAVHKNVLTVAASAKRLIEFEAKWRKRVEEGKP